MLNSIHLSLDSTQVQWPNPRRAGPWLDVIRNVCHNRKVEVAEHYSVVEAGCPWPGPGFLVPVLKDAGEIQAVANGP